MTEETRSLLPEVPRVVVIRQQSGGTMLDVLGGGRVVGSHEPQPTPLHHSITGSIMSRATSTCLHDTNSSQSKGVAAPDPLSSKFHESVIFPA